MMSDEQIQAFHEKFAASFQARETVADALARQEDKYNKGLDLIRAVAYCLQGGAYLEPDDYPTCPHCGKELLK